MAGYTLNGIRHGFFPTQTEGGTYNQRIIVNFTSDAYPDGANMPINVTVLGTDTIEQIITKCEDAANARLSSLYPGE